MADVTEEPDSEESKKTFSRVCRRKKNKDRRWTAKMSDEIYKDMLKCPECKCFLENPASMKCGHLICKTKCATGIMEATWVECPVCITITDLDKDKGIDTLQSLSLFDTIIAKLKCGIEPGLIQEYRILHKEMEKESSVFQEMDDSDIKLLPPELDCLKSIILQLEKSKCERKRPFPKQRMRKIHEKFKQLLMRRAARLIALPKDQRERLMAFWTERNIKFPPPPPDEVMDELHEKCKAQAAAIRIENEKPKVPSLLDIEISRPSSAGFGLGGPGHGGSYEGRSLLKPAYIYRRQSKSWNPETEETREEEQWVKDEEFDEEFGLEEDFYSISEIEHHGNFPPDTHMDRIDYSQFSPRNPHDIFENVRPPRPNIPDRFQRPMRPYHEPQRFGGMPHMGERPPLRPPLGGPVPRGPNPQNRLVPSLLSLNTDIWQRPPHPRHPMAEHPVGQMPRPNLPFGRDNQAHPMERNQQTDFRREAFYEQEQHHTPDHGQYQRYPPNQVDWQQQHQQPPPHQAPAHLDPQPFLQQQPQSERTPISEQQLFMGQSEPYQPRDTCGPHQPYQGESQVGYHQTYGEQTVAQAQPPQFNQQQDQYYQSQPYVQENANVCHYAQPVDYSQENPPNPGWMPEYMNDQAGETVVEEALRSDLKRSASDDDGSETGSTEDSDTPTDKIAKFDEG